MTPKPTFFATSSELRAWFNKHHDSADELWVGFHKKGSGEPSITWPESVDQALCFGWIDGIRKSIDSTRYMIRFSAETAQCLEHHQYQARRGTDRAGADAAGGAESIPRTGSRQIGDLLVRAAAHGSVE